ncbi:MAG: hypothetical protein ACI8ZM_002836 [Crocinitomix sp.]|jgi:hypothetical protein
MPIILSLFFYKRFIPVQRLLVVLVILAFTADITAYIFWQLWQNNNPIYHVYAVIEFFLILRIFKLELSSLFSNKLFNFVFVSFLVFAVINAVAWQNIFLFNSNVTTISSFLIIVLVLIYFFSLLQKENLEPLGKMPIFWISAGLMLYFSTNLVLFFISKNEIFALENGYTIWGIHAVVNIILFCFYTYALWIKPKTE